MTHLQEQFSGEGQEAAARDVNELLDLILASEGVQPEGAPATPFSPLFWEVFSSGDDLPDADQWLLPPPAVAPAAESLLVAPEARHVIVEGSREQEQNNSNTWHHQQQQKQFLSVGEVQKRAPAAAVDGVQGGYVAFTRPQQQQQQRQAPTSFPFAFLVPEIESIPVEGAPLPRRHINITVSAPKTAAVPHRTWAKRSAPPAPIDLGAGAVKAEPREKRAKVERYLQKRQRRLQQASRPAVYVRRTELANARPRVAGRFIAQPSGFVPVTRL